jgi:hypothetical protein
VSDGIAGRQVVGIDLHLHRSVIRQIDDVGKRDGLGPDRQRPEGAGGRVRVRQELLEPVLPQGIDCAVPAAGRLDRDRHPTRFADQPQQRSPVGSIRTESCTSPSAFTWQITLRRRCSSIPTNWPRGMVPAPVLAASGTTRYRLDYANVEGDGPSGGSFRSDTGWL